MEGKPTLLFIDYAVPQYDAYAGSRTNFMYLKMLVDMGLEVKFLGADFLRVEPYSSELNRLGIETLDGDWYRENWENWFKDNGRGIDYVFFHKPDPAAAFLPAVQRYTNAAIIYQCHDLHYLRLRRQAGLDHDKTILDEANLYEQKEDSVFTNSDVLLTFSHDEERIIREKFPHKKIFTVPLFFYENEPGAKHDFGLRRNLIFVGASTFTPNHDAITWFCNEVFPLIRQQLPDMVFNVVGADPDEDIRSLHSDNIRILGRLTEDELKDLYDDVRIMVVPLRYGAGVKGKVIEALYNGIPLVSTAIGLEGIKGIEQLLAPRDTAEDFAAQVISLYSDEKELQKQSLLGLKFIADNFSVSKTTELMTRILSVSKEQAAVRITAAVSDEVRIGQLMSQVVNYKHQLKELQGKLAERDRQIGDMLNSTSWRATALIRWIKQRAIGLKKIISK